jgi:PAS domain S-box-containing protein
MGQPILNAVERILMLKKKYMLILGGVLVFTCFIASILNITFNYMKSSRKWALRELEKQVNAGSKQLQFYVKGMSSYLIRIEKYLANNNMKVDKELYGYLNFARNHHQDAISEILILDANGNVVADTNPASLQSSFRESEYFKNTQHTFNKIYLSKAIIVSDLNTRPEVSPKIFHDPLDMGWVLYTGVYSKGVFKGAVLFVLRSEPFFNRYTMALSKLVSGYGFILQKDGRILFHRNVELRGKFLSDLPDSSDMARAKDLLKKTEEKGFTHRIIGQHMMLTSETYLPNQSWIVGISTTTSKLARKTLTFIYTLSGIVLLLGIIIFGLVFTLIRLDQARDALMESEARFRGILEAAENISFIMTDLAGTEAHILEFSPGAERIFGYSRKEVIGKPVAMLHLSEDVARFPDVIEAMKQQKKGFTGESTMVRKSGEIFPALFTTCPFCDAQGNMTASLGVSIDITEKKTLEAEAIRSSHLASLGKLAGGVAHEINNPINGIMNYAQLISDRLDKESPLVEFAGEIIHETNRVTTIVRNLLTFARQEKQTHSPARIGDIIEQTLSLIRTVFRHDQITLEINVPHDLPKIKCQSQQIQQVLMNLMTNARDALNERYPEYDPDKKLSITSQKVSIIFDMFEKEEQEWIRTTVEDHGSGIDPDIIERMFDPFFTTKPRKIGTGLGLSITYGIVQDHQGKLHVESEPGQYTRFHLDLPVDNGWELE